jgi:uncharacterized surface anchored protein
MFRTKTVSVFLCLLMWFVGEGHAQEITGSIVGAVHDQSGASIVGATISIQNADQNNSVVRVITTNENGEYVVPFLPVGHYILVAEAKDFKKVERQGVKLDVNDRLTINFSLSPGSVTESVTVEADASPVELQTATSSGLISGTEIRELAAMSPGFFWESRLVNDHANISNWPQ